MGEERHSQDWRMIGASVRGASHVRTELPNQDAIAMAPFEADAPLILAVSDGHGSAKYFRSHKGAQIAVKTAVEALLHFAKQPITWDNPAQVQKAAQKLLPANIVQLWEQRVANDLKQH